MNNESLADVNVEYGGAKSEGQFTSMWGKMSFSRSQSRLQCNRSGESHRAVTEAFQITDAS